MPDTSCLHIQDRGTGPIRVVDIPWISVRIGRAAYCEVQLIEDNLADEACRLYRKGTSWHIVPVAAEGTVQLDGRPIAASSPLPFDVPFRVGRYYLTLRHDRAAEPDWDIQPGPVPQERRWSKPAFEPGHREVEHVERLEKLAASPPPYAAAVEPARQPREAAQALDGGALSAAAAASVKDRWETRWRAAGAELKARAQDLKARSEAKDRPVPAGFDSVPLKERRVPRAQAGAVPRAQAAAVPRAQPPSRPIPTPAVAKVESSWTLPKTVPTVRPAPAQPSWQERAGVATPPRPAQSHTHDVEHVDDPGDPTPSVPAEVSMSLVAPDADLAAMIATQHDVVDPATEIAASQIELTPNVFAESLEAAIAAHELAARGQSEPLAEPISSALTEPDAPADTSAAAINFLARFGEGEPLILAEPTPVETTADAPESAVSRNSPSSSRTDDTPSGPDPGRRKQASSRGKSGVGARKEASHRTRMDRDSRPSGQHPPEPRSGAKPEKWPSAKEILATHCSRPRPQATPVQAARKTPKDAPTLAREPAGWSLPAWVAGPPAAVFVMAVGLASCTLSWLWAAESYSASIMTARLLAANRTGQRAPFPESCAPPTGSWTRSTAQHLAHWAIFMSFTEPGKEPSPREVRSLLNSALAVSPLNPTARLALAQLDQASDAPTISARGLGLSRDAISLSWCARRVLATGHKEDALRMYTAALNVAIERGPARAAPPLYNNDPQAPRYLLPGEECVRDIVIELLSKRAWTFDEWSAALPRSAMAYVAAARCLRERGPSDAQTLIDRVMDLRQPLEAVPAASALTLAARAEACALQSVWKQAEAQYRLAIEVCDDETIKRSWWFNLADIEQRLDDEGQRQIALRAAAVPSGDDIARRTADIQRANIAPSFPRFNGTKAN